MAQEKILIVEDERAVARGLEFGLQKEGYKTIWVDTGEKAIEFVRQHNPHLILLDIRLPGLSGFDVCRILRNEGKRQPILMLTARDEELDKVLGLELGADDYVVKPYQLRELIARIRSLIRRAYGDFAVGPSADQIIFGEIILDLQQFTVTRMGENVHLTSTEFKLLHFLASHPNRPFSREHLIDIIWDYDSGIGSDRIVDVHIRHLREKIEEIPSEPRWIITVRGVGYKFSLE